MANKIESSSVPDKELEVSENLKADEGAEIEDDCPDKKVSSTRIRVDNLPHYFGMKQVRKFLKDHLDGLEYQRLKTMTRVAIFSLTSEENTLKAMKILRGLQVKKCELTVKRVSDEPTFVPARPARNGSDNDGASSKEPVTASDLVTPLAGVPYQEQLAKKFETSQNIFQNLVKQIARSGAYEARQWRDRVKPVLPSPQIIGYRNKCEFCIARSSDAGGEIQVGFVQGRMAEREIRIVDVQNCINLTTNTLNIVRHFEQFIRGFDSRLDAFDEFKRTGFWKMLTVRDFHGDCMLVVTAHPHPDPELVSAAKKALVEKFMRFGNVREAIEFRVTSLYWQTIENASDPKIYEHLAGTPYIYETILGARFQISPSTFFQTNSRGAEVLYSNIGDALGLPSLSVNDYGCAAVEQEMENGNSGEPAAENGHESGDVSNNGQTENADEKEEEKDGEGSEAKRPKVDPTSAELTKAKPTVLLDICCGSGSIGICLMKRLMELTRLKRFSGLYGCVGVEIIPEAIRDAKINAENNGFSTKSCRYITGQAENIFKELNHYMPEGCEFSSANLLGIVDPPRAGVSDKVIIGCRKLNHLKRLVYVSCDPRAATKNLTDLCRPQSNKYEGKPFEIVGIQPVDMFPQTEHFEWIVTLERE